MNNIRKAITNLRTTNVNTCQDDLTLVLNSLETILDNLSYLDEDEISTEDHMIYLKNQTESFHCSCGCNVFKRVLNADKMQCNSCDARYTYEG